MPRRVAITGPSGLVGGALSALLRGRGDEVVHLVRRDPRSPAERPWRPEPGGLDAAYLHDVDAVVHLAGVGIGERRWNREHKEAVLRSRVDGTRAVAAAVARCDRPPRLVSGSAIGFYGSRGDEVLTEASGPGDGFLAEVVRAWEGATDEAVAAGASVALARTSLVMTSSGGAFAPMLLAARLGLGGPLGSGRQWLSWISLADEIAALAFLVEHPEITGPVNLAAPDPRPQREVAAALGAALHRPAVLPAPKVALRLVLGEMADELLLTSQRVVPQVLAEAGFAFEHPTIDRAAADLAG